MFTLLAALVLAAEPNWEVLSDGPVKVQQRIWPTGVVELQVESELKAPFEAVQETLLDCQNAHKFMPYVVECKRLAPVAEDGGQLTYTRVAPPLVANRDSVIRVVNDDRPYDDQFKQTWEAVPNALPEVQGVYRLKINQGSWRAFRISTGTRVFYRVAAEPGPGVAGFVMGTVNRSAMYDLFKAIEKEAQRRAK